VGIATHVGKALRKRGGEAAGGALLGAGLPKERKKERKIKKKIEKKVGKEEKYAVREMHELLEIKKELKKAKDNKDLLEIRNNQLRKLEDIERRMESRFKRLERAGKGLAEKVPDKKTRIEKDLKDFETYTNFLVRVLSRDGVLEAALTNPHPSNWFSELGKMTRLSDVGNDYFKARKMNSSTVVETVLKWDEGFYVRLKDFEKFLKKLE